MMEGISSVVEFLSVECDMIFEPEGDIEMDYQGGQGKERPKTVANGALEVVESIKEPPPSPTMASLSATIGEIFRHRSVGVYRRVGEDGPFFLIHDPTLHTDGSGGGSGVEGADGGVSSGAEEEGSQVGSGGGSSHRGIIKCSECHKQFHSNGRLLTHALTHIPLSCTTPTCPVCSAELPSRVALKIHVQRHFSVKLYQCQVCQEHYLTRTQLLAHHQLHSSPRQNPHSTMNQALMPRVPCQALDRMPDKHLKCLDVTSDQREALADQEGSPDGEQQPFKCDRCSATFHARSSLWTHHKCHRDRRRRRRHHHECPECGSQFWRSSALKRHRRAEHDV